jgi:hypothetical protein
MTTTTYAGSLINNFHKHVDLGQHGFQTTECAPLGRNNSLRIVDVPSHGYCSANAYSARIFMGNGYGSSSGCIGFENT